MIERIFNPVGQGAFYLERHFGQYNIVYDCGSTIKKTGPVKAQNVVKHSFTKGEVIDILFISHFDNDHINLIDTLKNHCRIKNVIIPYLKDDEIKLFYKVYNYVMSDNKARGEINQTIIDKPEEYFGDETNIIKVFPFEFEENHPSEGDPEPVLLNRLKSEIASGTCITLNNEHPYWCFIPYNINDKKQYDEFYNKVEEKGLNKKDLSNDGWVSTHIDVLKEIYKEIPAPSGNAQSSAINRNSMVLYSGPWKDNAAFKINLMYQNHISCHICDSDCCLCHFIRCSEIFRRPACIYTGDICLHDSHLQIVLGKYLKFKDYIGTIQVPHHGSIYSFDISYFNSFGPVIAPISFGKNNIYGHPSSSVISQLLSHRCIPIMITEDADSAYIQHIV